MSDTSFHGPDQPVQEKTMQEFLSMHLSLRALLKIVAQPNRCFDNAWRTMFAFPEALSNGTFVEGWIVFDLEQEVVLNEHGWCEQKNGTIVDPSILLLVELDQPVYYFPGVRRDWKEMETLVDEQQMLPYVRFDGKHGEDGLGHPGYKDAHDAAMRKVIKLANAHTPPKAITLLTAQDLREPGTGGGAALHMIVVSSGQRKEDTTDA